MGLSKSEHNAIVSWQLGHSISYSSNRKLFSKMKTVRPFKSYDYAADLEMRVRYFYEEFNDGYMNISRHDFSFPKKER